ncbi:hypothetical protein [Ancylobacter lacus]|uniref:hypothetical protein n=1 Tax=Ancylobacter lacus TaxID=2579970 RepID=UPI001BCC64D0|nr:hypothetical protein [Ancylobacter lacus]MBS7538663.1 hypothetical protein [Ancylobacter lacus]MBS7538664.1 hypothetical protein [Ancylobacter lacus]
MNKIVLATLALLTFGSVAANAADGRDPSLYGKPAATVSITEGRNAAAATAPVSDAFIAAEVAQNARSSR